MQLEHFDLSSKAQGTSSNKIGRQVCHYEAKGRGRASYTVN